jgi:hypothetical protein
LKFQSFFESGNSIARLLSFERKEDVEKFHRVVTLQLALLDQIDKRFALAGQARVVLADLAAVSG